MLKLSLSAKRESKSLYFEHLPYTLYTFLINATSCIFGILYPSLCCANNLLTHCLDLDSSQLKRSISYIIEQIMNKGYDRRYCEQFQNGINYEKIDTVWKTFREAGNSLQGKITINIFKKVMVRHGIKNEIFLEKLFERFVFDRSYEFKGEKGGEERNIDLQDFVIGLVLISFIPFDDKVKYIFYLTDLDEDGCLSLQEIQSMIERIQRIFCQENSSAKVQSFSLLIDLAHKKAQRNYKQVLYLLNKNNPSIKTDEGGLITCQEFIQALSESYDLYKQEKFIPLNVSLAEVIENVGSELSITITEDSKNDFMKFRKELYMILEKNKEGNKEVLRYPWKVEVKKDDKVTGLLTNYEKIAEKQKKNEKTILKGKNSKNEYREIHDQKTTQQTLQSYRIKVKKMIQTKQDPKLAIKFDAFVRK